MFPVAFGKPRCVAQESLNSPVGNDTGSRLDGQIIASIRCVTFRASQPLSNHCLRSTPKWERVQCQGCVLGQVVRAPMCSLLVSQGAGAGCMGLMVACRKVPSAHVRAIVGLLLYRFLESNWTVLQSLYFPKHHLPFTLMIAETETHAAVDAPPVAGVPSKPHSGHKHHKKGSDPFLNLDEDSLKTSDLTTLSKENADAAQSPHSLLTDVECLCFVCRLHPTDHLISSY